MVVIRAKKTAYGGLVSGAMIFPLIFTLFSTGTEASESPLNPWIRSACSADEQWDFPDSYESALRTSLRNSLVAIKTKPNLKSAAESFEVFEGLVQAKDAYSGPLFPTYGIARILYSLRYVHVAKDRFEKVLELSLHRERKSQWGILYGTLDCLNTISREYPTLRLSSQGITSLIRLVNKRLIDAGNATVHEAIFNAIKQLLLYEPQSNLLYELLKLLRRAGPVESLAKALIELRNGDYQQGTIHLSEYLRSPLAFLSRFEGPARVLLGRSIAGRGGTKDAIDAYRGVSVESNYFTDALSDIATLQLQSRKFIAATSILSNFQVAPLAAVLRPEAASNLVLALTRLCNYPLAMAIANRYHKQHDELPSAIGALTEKGSKSEFGLYQQALSDQKSQPGSDESATPSKLRLEWMRAPAFIAAQRERNLLLDECASLETHRQNAVTIPGATSLLKIVDGWESQVQEIDRRTLGQLNSSIAATNQHIAQVLSTTGKEVAQLTNEIVKGLANHVPDQSEAERRPRLVLDPKSSRPQLDWGRVPFSEAENAEIWDDELGAARVSVRNLCPPDDSASD